MRCQIRIIYHVVFIIRKHVGFTALCDCAQFHSQRIASCTIVFLRVTIATTSVVELTTAEYTTVSQIKPQILCEIAFLALPTTRWNLLAIVQLLQSCGMSGKSDKLYTFLLIIKDFYEDFVIKISDIYIIKYYSSD